LKTQVLIVTKEKIFLKIFCLGLAFGPKWAYNTYMAQTMRHPRQSGGSGIWKQNG